MNFSVGVISSGSASASAAATSAIDAVASSERWAWRRANRPFEAIFKHFPAPGLVGRCS